jgi:ubiquinone/menaquinone biosynthesis C-methylase UbiE
MAKKNAANTKDKKLSQDLSEIRNDRSRWIMERIVPDAQSISDILGINEGTLLDVGCGGGWLDIGLAQITNLNFVCVDISPRCVEGTKRDVLDFYLADRVSVLQADSQDLPFEDNTFDAVMSTASIGFWHNPQKGIEELYRVLKPGGKIFIRGFDGNRYSNFWDILCDTGIKEFAMTRNKNMSWITLWK